MARYWSRKIVVQFSCFCPVRGKIGYFSMQIVIAVLNKYLGIISFLEASKSNVFKWKGFLDFVKCVLCFIILQRMISYRNCIKYRNYRIQI